MSETEQKPTTQQKNNSGNKNTNGSNAKNSRGTKGKGKGKNPNNQAVPKKRINSKSHNTKASDKNQSATKGSEKKKTSTAHGPAPEMSIFDMLGGQVIEGPNILDEIFVSAEPKKPVEKQFIYNDDELRAIFETMKSTSLSNYVDCDSVTRLIYNIQIEKEVDEDDLWDMPNEDDEMDLSKPMNEFFVSTEAYDLARTIFNGEESFIPEDQKVAVMNTLYSLHKAKWDTMKREESFEGFTEQVVILSNDMEDQRVEDFEEELIREEKEKSVQKQVVNENGVSQHQVVNEQEMNHQFVNEQEMNHQFVNEQEMNQQFVNEQEMNQQFVNQQFVNQQFVNQQKMNQQNQTIQHQFIQEHNQLIQNQDQFIQEQERQHQGIHLDNNGDSLFTMLNQSSLSSFQTYHDNRPFSSGLMPSQFDYGYYPSRDHLFQQPSMNFNSPYMPFNTFNDYNYPFSNLSSKPLPEPEVFDLYADISGNSTVLDLNQKHSEIENTKEVKEVEEMKEEPKTLPRIETSVTLVPRCILLRKFK